MTRKELREGDEDQQQWLHGQSMDGPIQLVSSNLESQGSGAGGPVIKGIVEPGSRPELVPAAGGGTELPPRAGAAGVQGCFQCPGNSRAQGRAHTDHERVCEGPKLCSEQDSAGDDGEG